LLTDPDDPPDNYDAQDKGDTLPAPTETSTEPSDNNADVSDTMPPSAETSTGLPDNNAELMPDILDPAVVAENAYLITTSIKARMADLANATTDPEALTAGYERLFNDALRVQVCVELQDLLNNGGEELVLAKTQYGAQFAHLFDRLGIQNPFAPENNDQEMTETRLSTPSTDHEQKTRDPELMADIERLHTVADEVNPMFQARMAMIASSFDDCLYQPSDVKSRERIYEKVTGDYGGDLSRLKDVVRCRLIHAGHPVKGGAHIERIIRRANYPIAIDVDNGREMIKNGFVRHGRELPIDSLVRYTDIKMTIELYDGKGQGVLGEIVIATPEMAAATKVEHPLYEIIRTMETKIKQKRVIGAVRQEEITLLRKLTSLNRSYYVLVAKSMAERVNKNLSYQRSLVDGGT
jgi:hypothetical protein